MDFIWQKNQPKEFKFYTALFRFHNNYNAEPTNADLEPLKALVNNPLGLAV